MRPVLNRRLEVRSSTRANILSYTQRPCKGFVCQYGPVSTARRPAGDYIIRLNIFTPWLGVAMTTICQILGIWTITRCHWLAYRRLDWMGNCLKRWADRLKFGSVQDSNRQHPTCYCYHTQLESSFSPLLFPVPAMGLNISPSSATVYCWCRNTPVGPRNLGWIHNTHYS